MIDIPASPSPISTSSLSSNTSAPAIVPDEHGTIEFKLEAAGSALQSPSSIPPAAASAADDEVATTRQHLHRLASVLEQFPGNGADPRPGCLDHSRSPSFSSISGISTTSSTVVNSGSRTASSSSDPPTLLTAINETQSHLLHKPKSPSKKKPAKCFHGKTAAFCVPCRGSHICPHFKRKSRCVPCKGSQICDHKKVRAQCVQCNGSQICVHKKQKAKCLECQGSQICGHKKQKYFCQECKANTSPTTASSPPSPAFQQPQFYEQEQTFTDNSKYVYNGNHNGYSPQSRSAISMLSGHQSLRLLHSIHPSEPRDRKESLLYHLPFPNVNNHQLSNPVCRHGKPTAMCLKCLCNK